MKEKYEPLVIEVIHFETEDIITTSGGNGLVGEGEYTDSTVL